MTAAAATETSRPRPKSDAAPFLAPPVTEEVPVEEAELPAGAGGALVLVMDNDCPLAVAAELVEAAELAELEMIELCPSDVVLGAMTEEGDEVLTEGEPDAELLAAEEVVKAAGVETMS